METHRFDRQVDLQLMPHQSDGEKAAVAQLVSNAWRDLEERVRLEFDKSPENDDAEILFAHVVRLQDRGQLADIEVDSPSAELTTARDADRLCAAFEDTCRRIHARAASSPEVGYVVASAIVKGSIAVEQETAISARSRLGGEVP